MGLSSCRRNTPLGRFIRTFQEVADILAWACPTAFALAFLGGGLGALIKTRRSPTERSRAWARRLGMVNLAVGALFVFAVLTDLPRESRTETALSGEVEEVALRDGTLATRPLTETVHTEGPVDLGALLGLLAIGLAVTGLGAAGMRAGRRD